MRMRHWLVVSMLAFAAGCADPITRENFNKIQTGMTVQEVEAILGGRHPSSYETIKTWRGSNTRTITVEIDDRGLVANKTFEGL